MTAYNFSVFGKRAAGGQFGDGPYSKVVLLYSKDIDQVDLVDQPIALVLFTFFKKTRNTFFFDFPKAK